MNLNKLDIKTKTGKSSKSKSKPKIVFGTGKKYTDYISDTLFDDDLKN